jgi:hypothetical protein
MMHERELGTDQGRKLDLRAFPKYPLEGRKIYFWHLHIFSDKAVRDQWRLYPWYRKIPVISLFP